MKSIEELDKDRHTLIQRRAQIDRELIDYRADHFAMEKGDIFSDSSCDDPHAEWARVKQEMNDEKEALLDERADVELKIYNVNRAISRSIGDIDNLGLLDPVPDFLLRPDGTLDFSLVNRVVLKLIGEIRQDIQQLKAVMIDEE